MWLPLRYVCVDLSSRAPVVTTHALSTWPFLSLQAHKFIDAHRPPFFRVWCFATSSTGYERDVAQQEDSILLHNPNWYNVSFKRSVLCTQRQNLIQSARRGFSITFTKTEHEGTTKSTMESDTFIFSEIYFLSLTHRNFERWKIFLFFCRSNGSLPSKSDRS